MKKIAISIVAFVLGIVLYIAPVHAYGFNIGIDASNDAIIRGGTVQVTFSTKNFDFGNQGIDAVSGTIEYSKDVFETVTADDIQGQNNWGISYNDGKILCVPNGQGYVKTEGALFTITFKVKDAAALGETKITAKSFLINDAESGQRISTPDVSKTLSVKTISSNVYKFTEDKIVDIKPNTKVEDFKKNIIGTDIKVSDQSGNALEDGKFVGTGMTMTAGGETYTLIVMGDVNGDGTISTTDVAKMKMHLIELRKLEGAYLYAANVDGDEEVTITDLSKIRKAFFGELEL